MSGPERADPPPCAPALLLITVFGLGHLRPAPGTWGSLPSVAIAIKEGLLRTYLALLPDLCPPGDDPDTYGETVYTDASGHFRLTTGQQGELVLRARKLYFADVSRPIRLDAGSSMTVDLSLNPLTDAEDIAENLPPSAAGKSR